MFVGKTSWDQYRHCQLQWMGWCDGSTAALVSPGGGRPERGFTGAGTPAGVAGGLVAALTDNHSSPGRLADHRRRFERVSRVSDPSVFAVELERHWP